MIDFKIIGRRIKEERLEKSLSQIQLSEMMDISVAYLSRVEIGRTHISLKRLMELCSILEIPSSKIIDGSMSEESEYLNKEFKEILSGCDTRKKNLIYKMAKLIRDTGVNLE